MTNENDAWSWADALSKRVHAVAEIKRLRQQITNAKTTCGSCKMWMTNSCLREWLNPKTGQKQGPSCGAAKCDQFAMSASDAASIATAEKQIEELMK